MLCACNLRLTNAVLWAIQHQEKERVEQEKANAEKYKKVRNAFLDCSSVGTLTGLYLLRRLLCA